MVCQRRALEEGEEEEYLGMSLGSRVRCVAGAGVGSALLRCSLQYNFENK